MQFGLKEKTINSICSVFKKHGNIEKAIIYGSRAKDNFRNNSDIDITLIGASITLSQKFKIENELDDLLLPYKIDLSIHDKIENKKLKAEIKKHSKVFYENVILIK